MKISYALLDNRTDTTPKPREKDWEDIARSLTTKRSIRDKKDGLAIVPAIFRKEGQRIDADVEAITMLVLDVDDGTPPEALRLLWEQEGKPLACAVWSTHSSTAEKPKWRAVFPLSAPVPASEWPVIWRRLCYHLAEGRMDKSCSNESRLYYLPSCPVGQDAQAFAWGQEGDAIQPELWSDPPADFNIKPAREFVPDPDAEYAIPTAEYLLRRALERAEWDRRNNATFWMGCQLRDNQHSQEVAEDLSREFANKTFATPRDPFTEEEAVKAVQSAYSSEAREPWRKSAKAQATQDAAGVGDNLKEILVTNRPDRDISKEAWEEIHNLNKPPVVFSRGMGVSRLWFNSATQQHSLQMLDSRLFLHRIRRVADFLSVRQTKDGELKTHVPTPLRIAEDMLSCADEVAKLPVIRAVIYAPVMSSTGELLTTPGYHSVDGLYLAIDEEVRIPSDTSKEAAQAAWGRLFGEDGIFSEFPYATPTDRSHAGALLFSLFMRPRIHGCQPMFLVEAPEMGTGKSLLAKAILKIFDPLSTATNAPSSRAKEDAEAEWTKVIGAALKGGPSTLFLDNIRGTLASVALEGLITSSDIWKTRLLGSSEEISVWPGFLTIVGTSNNPDVNRDMVRRSISIRIDADMARPEMGRQFKIEKLEDYVKSHRAEIISDVLTILSAWKNAGSPERRGGEKGTFEEWSQLVGGVLDFLEVPGFLGNERSRGERMDPEMGRWAAFSSAWHKQHGCKRVVAATLIGLAVDHEIITANTDRDGNYDKNAGKALGRNLHRQLDRRLGEWRLSGTNQTSGKVWHYWLSESKEDAQESAVDNGLNGFDRLSTKLTHDPNKNDNTKNMGHREDGAKPYQTHLTHPEDDAPGEEWIAEV